MVDCCFNVCVNVFIKPVKLIEIVKEKDYENN